MAFKTNLEFIELETLLNPKRFAIGLLFGIMRADPEACADSGNAPVGGEIRAVFSAANRAAAARAYEAAPDIELEARKTARIFTSRIDLDALPLDRLEVFADRDNAADGDGTISVVDWLLAKTGSAPDHQTKSAINGCC